MFAPIHLNLILHFADSTQAYRLSVQPNPIRISIKKSFQLLASHFSFQCGWMVESLHFHTPTEQQYWALPFSSVRPQFHEPNENLKLPGWNYTQYQLGVFFLLSLASSTAKISMSDNYSSMYATFEARDMCVSCRIYIQIAKIFRFSFTQSNWQDLSVDWTLRCDLQHKFKIICVNFNLHAIMQFYRPTWTIFRSHIQLITTHIASHRIALHEPKRAKSASVCLVGRLKLSCIFRTKNFKTFGHVLTAMYIAFMLLMESHRKLLNICNVNRKQKC